MAHERQNESLSGPRRGQATPIARPPLVVDEVVRTIRNLIVSGELRPGERISENSLAARLGVSTTPVREAFTTLRREGLVTVRPQSGTYVFDLSPGELTQLCELRAALEPAAVKIAFERSRETLAAGLSDTVAQMRAAQAQNRIEDYLGLDARFHEQIIEAAGNAYLASAYALIGSKMAALRNRLGSDPHHMAKSMREHVAIAESIAWGDLDTAITVLVGHIARKEGSYWQHLDPSGSALLPSGAEQPPAVPGAPTSARPRTSKAAGSSSARGRRSTRGAGKADAGS